jgi:hypothetical protein
MKDGDIKICLEGMNWAIFELETNVTIAQFLMASCSLTRPPSIEFLFVCECLLVLQSGDEGGSATATRRMPGNFQGPDLQYLAQSWPLVKSFISRPAAIVESLKMQMRGRATSRRVEVINCYLSHPLWPSFGSNMRARNETLHVMAYYVEQWHLSECLTRERGGVPIQALTKGAFEGLDGVVYVSDVCMHDPLDLTMYATKPLHEHGSGEVVSYSHAANTVSWRMAVARLVPGISTKHLLVTKAAKQIRGIMYQLTVFREEHYIYFNAYDPHSSEEYVAVVALGDVPKLLMPTMNARMRVTDPSQKPPHTPLEMYKRLVDLLDIRPTMKHTLNKHTSTHKHTNTHLFPLTVPRKELVLVRKNPFLMQILLKIDGFQCVLKCYEGVLGEAYIYAHIPTVIDVSLVCVLTEETRLRLFEHGDGVLERDLAGTTDVAGLMPFVLDRLQVHPSKCLFDCMFDQETDAPTTLLNKHVTNDPVRVRPGARRDHDSHYMDPDLMPPPLTSFSRKLQAHEYIQTKGLRITVNTRHTVGRRIYRNVVYINNLQFLLAVKSITKTKDLRLVVYSQQTQCKYEAEISSFIRKLLCGCLTDNNVCVWLPKVISCLKLERNYPTKITMSASTKFNQQMDMHRDKRSDKHVLVMDLCSYRSIHKIDNALCHIRMLPLNDQSLTVSIENPESCKRWSGQLSLIQVIALINVYRQNRRHTLINQAREKHKKYLTEAQKKLDEQRQQAKLAEKRATKARLTTTNKRTLETAGGAGKKGKKAKTSDAQGEEEAALEWERCTYPLQSSVAALLPKEPVFARFDRQAMHVGLESSELDCAQDAAEGLVALEDDNASVISHNSSSKSRGRAKSPSSGQSKVTAQLDAALNTTMLQILMDSELQYISVDNNPSGAANARTGPPNPAHDVATAEGSNVGVSKSQSATSFTMIQVLLNKPLLRELAFALEIALFSARGPYDSTILQCRYAAVSVEEMQHSGGSAAVDVVDRIEFDLMEDTSLSRRPGSQDVFSLSLLTKTRLVRERLNGVNDSIESKLRSMECYRAGLLDHRAAKDFSKHSRNVADKEQVAGEASSSSEDWDFARTRRQQPVVIMADELTLLAEQQSLRTQECAKQVAAAGTTLHEFFMSAYTAQSSEGQTAHPPNTQSANPNTQQRNRTIKTACISAVHSIISQLERSEGQRVLERAQPGRYFSGLAQRAEKLKQRKLTKLNKRQQTKFDIEKQRTEQMKAQEIVATGEKLVYKHRVKVTFRDDKTRWHSVATVCVYESTCWFAGKRCLRGLMSVVSLNVMLCYVATETGPGRRLRFSVVDPQQSGMWIAFSAFDCEMVTESLCILQIEPMMDLSGTPRILLIS